LPEISLNVYQSINQSINQSSIDRSIDRSIQSINQSINQSIRTKITITQVKHCHCKVLNYSAKDVCVITEFRIILRTALQNT